MKDPYPYFKCLRAANPNWAAYLLLFGDHARERAIANDAACFDQIEYSFATEPEAADRLEQRYQEGHFHPISESQELVYRLAASHLRAVWRRLLLKPCSSPEARLSSLLLPSYGCRGCAALLYSFYRFHAPEVCKSILQNPIMRFRLAYFFMANPLAWSSVDQPLQPSRGEWLHSLPFTYESHLNGVLWPQASKLRTLHEQVDYLISLTCTYFAAMGNIFNEYILASVLIDKCLPMAWVDAHLAVDQEGRLTSIFGVRQLSEQHNYVYPATKPTPTKQAKKGKRITLRQLSTETRPAPKTWWQWGAHNEEIKRDAPWRHKSTDWELMHGSSSLGSLNVSLRVGEPEADRESAVLRAPASPLEAMLGWIGVVRRRGLPKPVAAARLGLSNRILPTSHGPVGELLLLEDSPRAARAFTKAAAQGRLAGTAKLVLRPLDVCSPTSRDCHFSQLPWFFPREISVRSSFAHAHHVRDRLAKHGFPSAPAPNSSTGLRDFDVAFWEWGRIRLSSDPNGKSYLDFGGDQLALLELEDGTCVPKGSGSDAPLRAGCQLAEDGSLRCLWLETPSDFWTTC